MFLKPRDEKYSIKERLYDKIVPNIHWDLEINTLNYLIYPRQTKKINKNLAMDYYSPNLIVNKTKTLSG